MNPIQEFLTECGCWVSCTTLRRFIQRRNWCFRNPRTVCIKESLPGVVAELDFGRSGYTHDPESSPPPDGVGPDGGSVLLQALLCLAHP